MATAGYTRSDLFHAWHHGQVKMHRHTNGGGRRGRNAFGTNILRSIPRVGTQQLVKIITGKLIIHLRRYEPFEDKCDAREGGRRGGATMKEGGKTSKAAIHAMRKAGILTNRVVNFEL